MTLAARIPPGADPAAGPVRRARRGQAQLAPTGEQRRHVGWRTWLKLVVLLAAAVGIFSAPWWGRRALSQLDFFRARQVEIVGARFLADSEILARLALDTTTSVWTDLGALERRLARHPQVASVELSRRLPGTLVVSVTEHQPVALVPFASTLRAVDGAGRSLPIDPTRVELNLPVVAQRDTAVLRMLDEVRASDPALFRRISEVRRSTGDEIVLMLVRPRSEREASADTARSPLLVVRARVGATPARLGELWAVEADLWRRGIRAAELDLRYRDQVVARLQ